MSEPSPEIVKQFKWALEKRLDDLFDHETLVLIAYDLRIKPSDIEYIPHSVPMALIISIGGKTYLVRLFPDKLEVTLIQSAI